MIIPLPEDDGERGDMKMSMNDLQKYLDTLPEPNTLREKLVVLWSDILDFFAKRNAERKKYDDPDDEYTCEDVMKLAGILEQEPPKEEDAE